MNMQTQPTTSGNGKASGSRAVMVPLNARRLRIIEDLVAQIGPRRPLSPAEALGLVVEWAPGAMAAIDRRLREQGVDTSRMDARAWREATGPDPDAWPVTASEDAVLRYRCAVLAVIQAQANGSIDYWVCSRCSQVYKAAVGVGRRWWECPSCEPSESLRRAVRRFRRGWSWADAEQEVLRAAERKRAVGVEDRTRSILCRFSSILAGSPRHAAALVEDRVASAARLEALPPVVAGHPLSEKRFRCRACSSVWEPFAPISRDSYGRLDPRAGELRGTLPWWACPKGCNAGARRRVLRLAHGRGRMTRRWVELWLGAVDESTCRRMAAFLSREGAKQLAR